MTPLVNKEQEFTRRFDLGVWKRLYQFALQYRKFYGILIACAVLIAAVEAAFPMITKFLIDRAKSGEPIPLLEVSAIYATLVLLFAVAVMGFIRLAGLISTGISHDIRQAGFNHLQDLSFSYFDRRPTGWLMARLTSDCDRLSRTLAWGVTDLIWGFCFIIGISAVMLAVHWKLTLVVLSVLPVLFFVSLYFQKRILKLSRAVRKQNSVITAAYSEGISGVLTTRTLVREAENLSEFRVQTGRMFDHSRSRGILVAFFFPLIMLLGGLAEALSVVFGAGEVFGGMSPGSLVLFLTCSGMLLQPIMEMVPIFADLQNTQASAERILGLIDTVPDVQDTPEVAQIIREQAAQTPAPGAVIDGGRPDIHEVEFRSVTFGYDPDRPVLKDFDLTVRTGQTVALVGPTGGGKTTIVSLLCRFYEPTGGEIRLDGTNYRNRSLHWLQSNLGIVLQEPYLFNGTITENIRYGRLDATDEEVFAAARTVHAHTFIEAAENGYDTKVGAGGVRLSTGQKQLVSFARAVLADPRIFVMDEATSSVDTETERRIQEGLSAVLAGRISFVVAHRLSTIRSADVILVIDGGQIIERGNHAELIAQKGRYYKLYTQQFSAEGAARILG